MHIAVLVLDEGVASAGSLVLEAYLLEARPVADAGHYRALCARKDLLEFL